jgi:hypothetical protein
VTHSRIAVLVNFGLRALYGAAMLAAPGRIGKPWLGRPSPSAPSDVPLRGVGGREVAVHLAGGAAILRGAPLRPWLLASLGGDLTDIASTIAQRRQLPAGGLRACLLAGGGSALLTLGLLAADPAGD